MYQLSARAHMVVQNPLNFGLSVLRTFRQNQAMLLAAAVAYHTLLSIIPILALTAIGLSQWFEPELVLSAARGFLDLIAPTQIEPILTQLETFIVNWKVIGLVGAGSLIFFSALAFSALESALAVIFGDGDATNRRKAWVSWLLPYAFVLVIGISIFLLTMLTGLFETVSSFSAGKWLPKPSLLAATMGFVGEIGMFAAVYYVLPRVPVSLKHALIGGFTAAVLWELMRRILVWYFANLSSVNVIYGAFATVLIIVLSLQVAITILLLGAQVIREYGELEADQLVT